MRGLSFPFTGNTLQIFLCFFGKKQTNTIDFPKIFFSGIPGSEYTDKDKESRGKFPREISGRSSYPKIKNASRPHM